LDTSLFAAIPSQNLVSSKRSIDDVLNTSRLKRTVEPSLILGDSLGGLHLVHYSKKECLQGLARGSVVV